MAEAEPPPGVDATEPLGRLLECYGRRCRGVIQRSMLLRAWLFLGLIAATLEMAPSAAEIARRRGAIPLHRLGR